MGTFLVYILKSSLCLALFYLFYRLLLSKETFHRFNRIALLGVMLISCLLPLVRVTVDRATVVNTSVMLVEEDMLMYPWEMQTVVQEEAAFPWREWLVAVYLLGIFFFVAQSLVVGAYALPDSPQPLPADGERYLSGYPSGGIRSFQLDEIHCHLTDRFG